MPATRGNSIATLVLVSLILAIGTAFAQGQDANWDLLNYHIYTPLAWLDGRLAQDIAVAQQQTWHNPILDLPLALMIRAGASGWLVTLWLALPAVIALFFALRLLDDLWPEQRSLLRTGLAGLVATLGAAAWSSTGKSFNDAFIAAGVLAGLWWAVSSQGRRGDWATWLPVGLMAGAVAGLKLTAAIYCVGFIVAACIAGPLRSLPSRLMALATGGLVAALITWGPWAWLLWTQHGNPVFPYFNQWFQSPDALPLSHKDERFLPRNLWQALDVPLRLLKTSRDFSEAKLSDPRLLLGLIALVAWSVKLFRSRDRNTSTSPMEARWRIVLALVLTSYVAWVAMYDIYRYLYPLEAFFSIAIIGVISASVPGRWRNLGMILAALAIVGVTKRPLWGDQDFRTPMVSVHFPDLRAESMILISSSYPVGHAVAFLPTEVPAVSLHNNFMDPQLCTRLQARVEARIAGHDGPLFLLEQAIADPGRKRIGAYGLSIDGECLAIQNSLVPMQLCPLARKPVNPICRWPPADR